MQVLFRSVPVLRKSCLMGPTSPVIDAFPLHTEGQTRGRSEKNPLPQGEISTESGQRLRPEVQDQAPTRSVRFSLEADRVPLVVDIGEKSA